MKIIGFILVFQIFPILTFGQTSDSDFNSNLLEKYVNRCVDSLETIEYLQNHLLVEEKDFCSLVYCLSFLEIHDKDSTLNQAIYKRLRQIAQKFYDEGTPILIHGNGMNSVEMSTKLNKEKNPYGVTYISLGNSCISSGSKKKGIAEFNLETKLLIDYQVSDSKKSKDKKKENRGGIKIKRH